MQAKISEALSFVFITVWIDLLRRWTSPEGG